MLLLEYWKPVNGYEKWYESNYAGIIRNIKTKVFKKYHIDKYGYPSTNVPPKGCKRVHRLVAGTFHLNTDNKPEVNHIDGNKLNFAAYNLEWNTQEENRKHAFSIGLRKFIVPTEQQIKFINDFMYSLSVKEISLRLNIHIHVINRIVGTTGLKHPKPIIDLNTGVFYTSDELSYILGIQRRYVTRMLNEERKPNTTQYRYC